jgi:hypothetical protein
MKQYPQFEYFISAIADVLFGDEKSFCKLTATPRSVGNPFITVIKKYR